MRLGNLDAFCNAVKEEKERWPPESPHGLMWTSILELIEVCPTIDPETLPIVQRLKAELAEVKAERDALLKELSGECGVCSHYDDCIKNHYSCCDGSNWEYCGPKKEE